MKQRCSLTAVGLYTGLSLSVLSLHRYTTGRVGGGLNRGNKKHTLASQGDVMSLMKQVTGHFLQTERAAGVTLKVCFFILIPLSSFNCFDLVCFALLFKPGSHTAQAVLEPTKKLRIV